MRKHLVKSQKLDVIESKKKYWDQVYQGKDGQKIESPLANPDQLSEASGMYAKTEEQEAKTLAIMSLIEHAKVALTANEWKVFNYVAIENHSLREASNVFDMSRITITKYYDRAIKKCQDIYENL